MSYPAVPFQKGLRDALLADAAVQAAMGGEVRAHDFVPPNAAFPYITLGEAQFLDDGDACEDDAYEAFIDLQVWSRSKTPGSIEAKHIAGAMRGALLGGVTVEGFRVTATDHRSTDHFRDPDGLTARARLNFRFLLEPA
jgi:hypothetical protein